MLALIYAGLWRIAPPVIRWYLRRCSHQNPDYLCYWNERFGVPYLHPMQQPIWVHAVSVGEMRAAQPLIAELQKYFPKNPLLITQMTPTGRATAQQLYPQAQCRYLPYDRADWVAQFLCEHRPVCGIIMETEIWVNLFQAASQTHVPLFLANARLSVRSLRGYLRVASFIRPALTTLAGCFAQTADDAVRLQTIGAANVQIMGNTKYDLTIPNHALELSQYFRQKWGKRRVFLAASLRENEGVDEAEIIARAWAKWGDKSHLLVLVPRHLERFQAAFDAVQKLGLRVQKRSENAVVLPETQVLIGDSMGEMLGYYGASDVVFVGGSLVDTGCQNIIEPMACGKPVLFGQSVFHFQAACDSARSLGAAIQVRDADELVRTAQHLLEDTNVCAQMAERAIECVAQHRGASARMAAAIAAQVQTN